MSRPIQIRTGIPVEIHPSFLVLLLIISGSVAKRDLKHGLIVAAVGAFSILWHELGHALAGKAFGKRPSIALTSYGGLTSIGLVTLPFKQELAFAGAGPAAGFVLWAIARAAMALPISGTLRYIAAVTAGINLVWSILNLVPVQPLDGGGIARSLLVRWLGPKGARYMQVWSFLGSIALFIAGFVFLQDVILTVFAFFMAVSSFRTARMMALMSDEELHPEVQLTIQKVVDLERDRRFSEAYELLLPLEAVLGPRNSCALAIQACELGNYEKAAALSEKVFLSRPKDFTVAFLAARAHAGKGDAVKAGEWLRKSKDLGMPKLPESIAGCRELAALNLSI